jgi:branched-chain amino acid aminotransferase
VGDLLPAADARVSVFDHGFTVADGVFETLKVVDGVSFALGRHLARLQRSATTLGLGDIDLDAVRTATGDVLAHEPCRLGRLRITVTSGAGPLSSDRVSGPGTLVIALTAMDPWPDTTTVATVPWPRNEHSALAGVKCTAYADNVHALADARARGASEAILANTRGQLCEGTATNVFIAVDGVVLTPPLSSGCLPGITRELLLEWWPVLEADLRFDAIHKADEVFITSSTRDVHPVVRVDDRDLAVGPVTSAVRELFAARCADNSDP